MSKFLFLVFYKYATLFNSFETSEYLQNNWATNHCNGTIPSVFWHRLRSTQEFDVFWVFFVSLHSNDHIIITTNTDWVFFDVPLVSYLPLVSCLPKMLGERPWHNQMLTHYIVEKIHYLAFFFFQNLFYLLFLVFRYPIGECHCLLFQLFLILLINLTHHCLPPQSPQFLVVQLDSILEDCDSLHYLKEVGDK